MERILAAMRGDNKTFPEKTIFKLGSVGDHVPWLRIAPLALWWQLRLAAFSEILVLSDTAVWPYPIDVLFKDTYKPTVQA